MTKGKVATLSILVVGVDLSVIIAFATAYFQASVADRAGGAGAAVVSSIAHVYRLNRFQALFLMCSSKRGFAAFSLLTNRQAFQGYRRAGVGSANLLLI